MAKRLMVVDGSAKGSGPPASVLARIARHLATRAFKSTAASVPNEMVFSRGSAFGSSTSFSPAKWEVTLTITRGENDDFTTLFEVNTTGQTVNDSERAYWAEESAALVDVIDGREPRSLAAADKYFAGSMQRLFKLMFGYALMYAVGGIAVGLALTAMGFSASWPPTLLGIGAFLGLEEGMRKALTGPRA